MSKAHPIEIFMPPNMLKAKIGGRVAGIDMAAIRRAEGAIAGLQDEFEDWLLADVTALDTAYDAFKSKPDAALGASFYRASHDIKGQALSFGFPLVARVAASLCKLMDADMQAPPQPLIDAHVKAIRIMVGQKVDKRADVVARTLTDELEARVDEYLQEVGVQQG